MDSSPSLERHLSSTEEAQLAEALERRKKQIYREIAEYTAEKEKEFRKFEKRLRSEKRDAERQKILQVEREGEKAEQKRRGSRDLLAVSPEATKGDERRGTDENSDGRANGVRFLGAVEIPPDDDTGQGRGKSEDQQPFHEREVEFQGLFTPSFMPLLSGNNQEQEYEKENANPIISRPQAASRPEQKRASSALAVSDTQDCILDSEPLTPADPRKMSMSARRSSSRSDTSVSSLRSSLRDRKQARSPKRVLFSIDNVVVSPSTSPTMQRKLNSARKNKTSNGSNDLVSQLESTDITQSSREVSGSSSVWRLDPAGKTSRPSLTNIPTTNDHTAGNGNKPAHPAAWMTSTSPSMGGDGFEHIRREEDDDLFAFDEDIKFADKEGEEDNGDEEIRDEDLEKNLEELPTSSPHAGSLPIEIRWPGRKDPRG
ncbi:MAG: hypothetical protein Q9222_004236 [Ikaeria aurantiellina]